MKLYSLPRIIRLAEGGVQSGAFPNVPPSNLMEDQSARIDAENKETPPTLESIPKPLSLLFDKSINGDEGVSDSWKLEDNLGSPFMRFGDNEKFAEVSIPDILKK